MWEQVRKREGCEESQAGLSWSVSGSQWKCQTAEDRKTKEPSSAMQTNKDTAERREEADLTEKAHHRDPNLHLQDAGQNRGKDKHHHLQKVTITLGKVLKIVKNKGPMMDM